MIQKPRKRSHKKLITTLAAVLVIAVVAGLLIWHFTARPSPEAPKGIKLAPATNQEKADAAHNKDRLVQEKAGQTPTPTPNSTTPSNKKQVNVLISDASADRVSAYVTGIFEDGGTCTGTFTQGSTVVHRTSAGFSNVSYTQCAPITPNLPNTGTWSVVVDYSSASATGHSKPSTF